MLRSAASHPNAAMGDAAESGSGVLLHAPSLDIFHAAVGLRRCGMSSICSATRVRRSAPPVNERHSNISRTNFPAFCSLVSDASSSESPFKSFPSPVQVVPRTLAASRASPAGLVLRFLDLSVLAAADFYSFSDLTGAGWRSMEDTLCRREHSPDLTSQRTRSYGPLLHQARADPAVLFARDAS